MPKTAQEIAVMLLEAIALKTSYKQADLTYIDDYALLHRDTFESLLDDLFQESELAITRAFLELYDEGFNYRNFKENQHKIYEFDLTVTQVMKKNILSDGAILNLCINSWAYFFDNEIKEKDFDYKAQMQLDEMVKNQRAQLVEIDSKILTCRHHLEKDEKKYNLKDLRVYKKSMDKFPKIIEKIKSQVYQNQLEIAHLNGSQFMSIKERHHSIYNVELDQLTNDIFAKKEIVDHYYQTRVRQHLLTLTKKSFVFLLNRIMMLSLLFSSTYLLLNYMGLFITTINISAMNQVHVMLLNIENLLFANIGDYLIYMFYIPIFYFLMMQKSLLVRILSSVFMLLLVTLDLYGAGLFFTDVSPYSFLSWLFNLFAVMSTFTGLIFTIFFILISIYLVIHHHPFLNLVFRICLVSFATLLLMLTVFSTSIIDLFIYVLIILSLLTLIVTGLFPIFKLKSQAKHE